MTTPRKPKTKPLCGNCGKARLVTEHTFEGAGVDGEDLLVKPEGNVGVCPVCGHAAVLDWDKDEELSNAPG